MPFMTEPEMADEPLNGTFRFMELPQELKNIIYSFSFPHKYITVLVDPATREGVDTSVPPLFLINRTIYEEARPYFFNGSTFRIYFDYKFNRIAMPQNPIKATSSQPRSQYTNAEYMMTIGAVKFRNIELKMPTRLFEYPDYEWRRIKHSLDNVVGRMVAERRPGLFDLTLVFDTTSANLLSQYWKTAFIALTRHLEHHRPGVRTTIRTQVIAQQDRDPGSLTSMSIFGPFCSSLGSPLEIFETSTTMDKTFGCRHLVKTVDRWDIA